MLLSLEIIKHFLALQDAHIISTCRNHPDSMRLSGAALWVDGGNMEYELCYVINGETVSSNFVCPSNLALIIIGDIDPNIFRNANADIMLISAANSFNECFNKIVEVFTYFNTIDKKISDCLFRNASIQELISVGQLLFHNPVFIFDQNFCSITPIDSNDNLTQAVASDSNKRILKAEVVDAIKTYPAYRNRLNTKIVTFFLLPDCLDEGALFSHYCWGNCEFTVCVPIYHTPLAAAHNQLIEYFSMMIRQVLQNKNLSNYHSINFENFIKQLLQGTQIEQAEIERNLFTMGWRFEDNYVCIVMQPHQWDWMSSVFHNNCFYLEGLFAESFAFFYENKIILIINLDKGMHDRKTVIQRLSPVLRDQLFRAGISYTFWEFSTLLSYYKQALGALEMGMLYHPDEWSYNFERYALQYFIHYGASTINGRHLCSPALVRLYIYDDENKTDLLQTLKVFLQQERNATLASQALYVHRNTLYQRLEKIYQLTHLDLENPDTRLFLLLSYSVVENLRLQPVKQLLSDYRPE